VNVSQIGTVELRLRNTHGEIVRIAIGDVLFHEQFASNLLSGELLRQKHGWEYHGERDGSYVVTPGGHRVALSTQSRVAVLLDAGE
jgi:choline kinase